jgi:hypothetical protein
MSEIHVLPFFPATTAPYEVVESAMATISSRSIRIRGVAVDITKNNFHEFFSTTSNEKRSLFSWRSSASLQSSKPAINHSLAKQNEDKIATVTFASGDAKARALEEVYPDDWVVDDVFNGVTVLYSPSNDIVLCPRDMRDDDEDAELE